jgi:hypothetical protein
MHQHASREEGEEVIVGVTRDPILRPAAALLVVVGSIWALFWGMAEQAGTLAQPLAAVTLIALGVLLAGVGKREVQI